MESFEANVIQNIKEAVKLKLLDLGAYVDDELPDYIMVMVANKKSKLQMNEDLSLFLGSNTESFTSWLHDMMIQSYSSSVAAVAEGPSVESVEDKNAKELKVTQLPVVKSNQELQPQLIEPLPSLPPTFEKFDEIKIKENVAPVLPEIRTSKIVAEDIVKIPVKTIAQVQPVQKLHRINRTPSSVATVVKKEPRYIPTFSSEPFSSDDRNSSTTGTLSSVICVQERSRTRAPPIKATKLLLKAVEDANKSINENKKVQVSMSLMDTHLTRNNMSSFEQVPKTVFRTSSASTFMEESCEKPQVSDVRELILCSNKWREDDIKVETGFPKVKMISLAVKPSVKEQHDQRELITCKDVRWTEKESDDIEMMSDIIVPCDEEEEEEYDEWRGSEENEEYSQVEKLEFSAVPDQKHERIAVPAEDMKPIIHQKELITKTNKPVPVEPKFIVTLNGVDPRSFLKRKRPIEEQKINSPIKEKERNVEHMDYENTMPDEEIMEAEEEVLEEADDWESSSKKQKVNERCRYWPSCKNASECNYQHPSSPCKAFPKCKYGNRCLFIHPNCKFDARCTKKECPYTHASKRVIPTTGNIAAKKAPPSSSNVPCKFYPNCTIKNCKFFHQKQCFYGNKCTSPTCPYNHGSLPSRFQLKWTASERKSS